MDMDKAIAELEVLRGFIDFVNRQVGVYCDCLAGFQGNKVRIERQMPRVQRPTSRRIEDGQPVIVWTSVEDPARPDILHHRIIRSEEFISTNSELGFNEQQICWSIIVFIFTYWEEEIRPQIAKIRQVESKEVVVDALGDLRTLRNSIIHDGGILHAADFQKLKVMKGIFTPDASIALSHDQMHKIFVFVKQAIATLISEYTGHLPGAPNPKEITGIAIQGKNKSV